MSYSVLFTEFRLCSVGSFSEETHRFSSLQSATVVVEWFSR